MSKKVPITFWVNMEIELPDDYTDENIKFYVEENHCIQNYIDQLSKEVEEARKSHECVLCGRGNAIVGEINIDKLYYGT
jgi:hypothetical protein